VLRLREEERMRTGLWLTGMLGAGALALACGNERVEGQTIRVYLRGTEDSTLQTSFLVDDAAFTVTR